MMMMMMMMMMMKILTTVMMMLRRRKRIMKIPSFTVHSSPKPLVSTRVPHPSLVVMPPASSPPLASLPVLHTHTYTHTHTHTHNSFLNALPFPCPPVLHTPFLPQVCPPPLSSRPTRPASSLFFPCINPFKRFQKNKGAAPTATWPRARCANFLRTV